MMPIRYESVVSNKICYGTPDGQILGELDSIPTIELSAEAEQYADLPTFTPMEFSGTFHIESNNHRKMHGRPLQRGKINWHEFKRALTKRVKKRNRKGWIYFESLAECPYCGYTVNWMDRERHCPCCEKRLRVN